MRSFVNQFTNQIIDFNFYILEYLKKDGIQLANKDDSDLFQILNRFSIRHHNRSQQGAYDKIIFLSLDILRVAGINLCSFRP